MFQILVDTRNANLLLDRLNFWDLYNTRSYYQSRRSMPVQRYVDYIEGPVPGRHDNLCGMRHSWAVVSLFDLSKILRNVSLSTWYYLFLRVRACAVNWGRRRDRVSSSSLRRTTNRRHSRVCSLIDVDQTTLVRRFRQSLLLRRDVQAVTNFANGFLTSK